MTSRDLQEVARIAREVRDQVIEDEEDVRAMCFDATKALASELKRAGFSPIRVQGTFGIDDPDPEVTPEAAFESGEAYSPTHHWVELDGLVVDVTASQFNDEIDSDPWPEVVIGKYKDLERYTPIKKSAVRR